MEKNIVLIGFMGTGKSSVGLKLSEKLKMKFVDMDREIEKVTGMSVSSLFRKFGEIRFRSEERLMAQKLSKQSNLVIATGGGVVLEDENIQQLRENGIMIWLQASPEDILARVNRKKGTRPLLKRDLKIEDIEDMLRAREHLYSCTNYRINTSNKDIYTIVNEIHKIIKQIETS
ncbi:MAG: shikimate kinase [Syntrophomonadaceae bacterium]|nr:shikimate kinase [Syntrophomonadaceae bacterium]MDD3022858.1 shikimate kinase [Syntrophomonadaceae bacterium]